MNVIVCQWLLNILIRRVVEIRVINQCSCVVWFMFHLLDWCAWHWTVTIALLTPAGSPKSASSFGRLFNYSWLAGPTIVGVAKHPEPDPVKPDFPPLASGSGSGSKNPFRHTPSNIKWLNNIKTHCLFWGFLDTEWRKILDFVVSVSAHAQFPTTMHIGNNE